MLNMLIAIMGDTFGRVMENKDVNATMKKIELLVDTAPMLQGAILGGSSSVEEEMVLFVVTPEFGDDEDGDQWGGQVNRIESIIGNRTSALQ